MTTVHDGQSTSAGTWVGPLRYYDMLSKPQRCEACGAESNPTVHSGIRFCLDHYQACEPHMRVFRASFKPVQLDLLDLLATRGKTKKAA